jgi:hypothetical protein
MADWSVVNAPVPASYSAPMIGFMLGDRLAQLPQQYMQGVQNNQRLQMLQPVIDPRTGQPSMDPVQIMQAAAQRGGLTQQINNVQTLYGMQNDELASRGLRGDIAGVTTAGAPSSGPAGSPYAAGPANLRPRPQQPRSMPQGTPQQPPLSAIGASDVGQDTIRSVVTEFAGGEDATAMINGVSRYFRTRPDQPLQPAQVQEIRAALAQLPKPTPQRAGRAQTEQAMTAESSPVADSDGGTQRPGALGTPPFAPQSRPSAGVFGSPGAAGELPLSSPRQLTESPDAIGDPTLGGLVPQSLINNGWSATQYRDHLAGLATRFGIKPEAKAALEKRVDQINEYLSKSSLQAQESALRSQEPTREMKNARDPNVLGAAARNEEIRQQVQSSQKTYNGIQGQALQYVRELQPLIEVSRTVLDNPAMYSDAGGNWTLDRNRVRAALGDPQAALLQEALQKVTPSSVLDQINAQRDQLTKAGGRSALVFQAQLGPIEKVASLLGNAANGNRLLLEISDRLGQQSLGIAQMAQHYVEARGTLDPQFDAVLARWLAQHPLFAPDELRDVRRIAPPFARTPDDLRRMGWRDGDPVRVPWIQGAPGMPPAPTRRDGTSIITHLPNAGATPQPVAPGPVAPGPVAPGPVAPRAGVNTGQ